MTSVPAQIPHDLPKAANGMTLPLSRSLDSRALDRHRAMVGFEMEVLAKKYDRFGWERERGSAAHNRLIADWMDALQDYTMPEIQAACKAAMMDSPDRMPNEAHILAKIQSARAEARRAAPKPTPERKADRVSPEAAREILEKAGFAPRRVGQ